ncbi:MAG: hypothetical protein OXF88_10470 [Rhodobacteraceae bacterium]|nr:hypothetical protein [Paracoccaceae bacterium]MCY4141590.1 hypothetical protein [Paracoccaceae bacterium]
MKAPDPDEIEVTVFGPGYGECIVIHAGSGKWLVIDSCLDRSREPASIVYLRSLGVKPEKAVATVAASHWHDDHIKGLSKTVKQCRSARLAFSNAFTKEEFLALLYSYEDQPVGKIDRGGTEFLKCLQHAQKAGRQIKPLSEDTVVIDFDAGVLAHKQRVELRALSPSSAQFFDFLRRCPSYVNDNIGEPKTRLVAPRRNDLSVAMLFSIGEQAVLLGADLEEVGDPEKGWQAVVKLRGPREHLAHIHKIPHHGSSGAHLGQVWQSLLHRNPWSVVTPWIHGGIVLPKPADKARIRRLSTESYLTSTKRESLKKNYDRETLKHIKRSGVDFRTAVFSGGFVTFRWTPPATTPSVSLYNGAVVL